MVDSVTEDVEILVTEIERGDLNRAHQRQRAVGRCSGGKGLVKPVNGVVVTKREQINAGFVRGADYYGTDGDRS